MLFAYSRLFVRLQAFWQDRSGAAAIVMALLLPVLLGGLAFGAEAGFWGLQKRKLQNAADFAVYSAAMQKKAGITNTSSLRAVGLAVATEGGYKLGSSGMTLVSPPTSGAYVGNGSAVQLSLDHTIKRSFSSIFSSTPVAFTVRATALIGGGEPACVLALDPSASGALSIGGSTDVTLTGCSIAANSTSSSAIQTTGNAADLVAECASTPGGVSDSHGVLDLNCGSAKTGAAPVSDPYASVPEPTPGSCASFSTFTSGNPANPNPGCYTLSSGNNTVNKDIQLKPGVYTFNGSGTLRLNGNNSMTGTGVTLFFTGGASVVVNGNFDLDIKAPTSGTYSGIAIFGSRTNAGDFDLSGNSGVAVVGAIYAPKSMITYTGNTGGFSAGECTQVIGGKVKFWGSAEFDTDCSNSGTTQITTTGAIQIVE